MNIKALTAAAAFGLAVPFSAVLVSAPAHADRCDLYRPPGAPPNSLWQKCENDNTVANNGVKPVCGPGGAGGTACTDCTGALSAAGVTDGDALTQSWYDCGQNGGVAKVTTKPHCYVNGVSTGQPPNVCYGNFIPDGTGGATLAETG